MKSGMRRIKELRKVERGENSEHLACQRRSRILAKTHDMGG